MVVPLAEMSCSWKADGKGSTWATAGLAVMAARAISNVRNMTVSHKDTGFYHVAAAERTAISRGGWGKD
jgi:hypothetical protein